jgi:hypothetical protein
MEQVSESPAICNFCGELWDINHVGLCPKFGKGKKLININCQETINIKDSVEITGRREFYKTNKLIYGINVGIIVLCLLIGLLFGIIGSFISFIISLLIYIFAPPAITKIRKIINWKIK